jgi:hypothetical protein
MVKHITNMLKKDHEVKWTVEAKESFQQIKMALGEAPVLIIPNYDKEFLIFSFASIHTIVVVLLQKNEENQEQPIAFFSKALRDVELKYSSMEKIGLCISQSIKGFQRLYTAL